MKRLLLAVIATTLLVAISGSFAPAARAQDQSKETAVVELPDRTRLLDVVLQGKYLFEHDDNRMARGEPCMHIYNYVDSKAADLAVAFHCKPVERAKAKELILNVAMTGAPDLFELKEIQFAGSTKGHIIPSL